MKNSRYLRNTAILFVSMTITKIVGAVFKIPLANILGGTGMGYFSTAYGLYSPVFALTAAGIPTVMMRLTAQNLAAGRPENAIKTRRTAMLLFSAAACQRCRSNNSGKCECEFSFHFLFLLKKLFFYGAYHNAFYEILLCKRIYAKDGERCNNNRCVFYTFAERQLIRRIILRCGAHLTENQNLSQKQLNRIFRSR